MYLVMFEVFGLDQVGRPILNMSGTILWPGGLDRKKGKNELSPTIHHAPLPDCGYNVTKHCKLLSL